MVAVENKTRTHYPIGTGSCWPLLKAPNVIVAFAVGAGCRFFDMPVPSPAVLPGAVSLS